MNFMPAPANDFPEFIETYYERCRERVPWIEGIAGKWTFEDLIPGLSDFDVRFIVNGPLTAYEWGRMAMEVAEVHLQLALERKSWARTLEHLPGVNLSWDELLDPAGYYPEFAQWTFYHGPRHWLQQVSERFANRPWDEVEEAYHWKKIASYYDPYNREIDPPINLGPYVDKYPLHSRAMHYLAPAVHSMVCLRRRRTTPGKLEAFRAAAELFPNGATMRRILGLIDCHYESEIELSEPGMTEFDGEMLHYLRDVLNDLSTRQTWLRYPLDITPGGLRKAVRVKTAEPRISQFFELIKFGRLMKGRLWFYAHDVAWFDSLPLIRIEMNRIRANFLEKPLELYAALCLGRPLSAEECLRELEGGVLSVRQVRACRQFAEQADPACPRHGLRVAALKVVECYDPFLDAMETLAQHARLETGPVPGHL